MHVLVHTASLLCINHMWTRQQSVYCNSCQFRQAKQDWRALYSTSDHAISAYISQDNLSIMWPSNKTMHCYVTALLQHFPRAAASTIAAHIESIFLICFTNISLARQISTALMEVVLPLCIPIDYIRSILRGSKLIMLLTTMANVPPTIARILNPTIAT